MKRLTFLKSLLVTPFLALGLKAEEVKLVNSPKEPESWFVSITARKNVEYGIGEEVSQVKFYKKYLSKGRLNVINEAFKRLYRECEAKGYKPGEITTSMKWE